MKLALPWPHALLLCALFGLLACGGSETAEQRVELAAAPTTAPAVDDDAEPSDADDAQAEALASSRPGSTRLQSTPLTLRVDHRPTPVRGSDGRFHVAYELELSNLTGNKVAVNRLDVLDVRGATVVGTRDAAGVAQRLVVRDRAATPGSLGASQVGLLYLHLIFDTRAAIPWVIEHRISTVEDTNASSFTAARQRVSRATRLVLDAPLRGRNYIAGDGCCDSTRHVRATLAINGGAYTAQRFAIDWEQLDEQGRIYVGDQLNPESYIIYGEPAYAVADAKVAFAVHNLPDSPIGGFPTDIPIEQADGNHVILDLGDGRYALYAHFKPGSVQVRQGQHVRRGQVLGHVGTSGNSSEPHLHFHVMDGSSLASNGLPHRLRHFMSSRRGVSTAAFDQAIIDGQPIATEPVAGDPARRRVLPLDLWIVDFPQ